MSCTEKTDTVATTEVENENKEDEDVDARILNEMEELTYAMDRKKKHAKKLLAKRRAKVSSFFLTMLAAEKMFVCTTFGI